MIRRAMVRSRPSLPIGISDFRELRRKGHYYVDKSLLIEQVFSTGAKVLLLPRPRRFGKTLNLSMLRYFVEHSTEDRSPLFAGLQVEGVRAAGVALQDRRAVARRRRSG